MDGKTFEKPAWLGGGTVSVGWSGISVGTPDVALVSTLPIRFATAAAGGIIDSPTLTMVGEGGESEAIVPLSKASEFGFGGGGPSVAIYADTINGWDNLRDLLAEAGLEVQLSGARDSFAGI